MLYLEKLVESMEEKYETKYISLCVAYSERLISKGMPVIFDGQHLAKLLGINFSILSYYVYSNNKFYQEFEIDKKSGGSRKIEAPSRNLKKIQRWILDNILNKVELNENTYGFRKGFNIVDNAKNHTNKFLVYNIDIKDFFPSITREDVFYIFYNKGYTYEVSYIFSKLLTYKDHLPHGAPTSPYIANLRCEKMDYSLNMYTKRINADYSRYADDITISTNNAHDFIDKIKIIKKIITNNGFVLNEKKERIQYYKSMQEVTGLVVNNGVKVRRRFKKELEKEIYYCLKYGVSSHLTRNEKNHLSFYKEYLYGKVNFIKMVEPELAEFYLKQLSEINWYS